MKRYRFSRGQRMLIGEREYIVEQELSDVSLQLRDVATNMASKRSVQSLLDIFSDGKLKLLHDVQTEAYASRKMGQMREADIALLPEDIKAQLDRRYAYVSGAIKKGIICCTAEAFKPIVKEISTIISDTLPPSAIQVYRWYSDYKKSGECIKALIPMVHKRGNRQQRLSCEEFNIITSVIKEKYLTLQRLSINAVHEAVVAEMGRQNKLRSGDDKLHIPSYVTVYNHIKKVDPYEVMKARYGKLTADRNFRPMQKGPEPTYPLERVEIDHIKIDLFVVDMERKMPIGRPWLTSAIDVYSKCILGIYISFNPPSYLSVMKCLLNAIKPKGYIKNEFDGIKYSWAAYGIMDTIVVDNGKEFWSKHFEDACLQLGIAIQYAPVKLAWYKGTIERHFRTLNTGLLHDQPGTTFSNVIEKGDYDPKKNAIISFSTLRWAVHKWIIDVYHRDKHKGINNIPAIVWEKGIEAYPPAMPSSISELQVMIGMMAERTITKSGIEFEGLFYNDENLNKFRRETKEDGNVQIKYDPEDLSVIYVGDSIKKTFFPVRAVNQKHTQGLTVWQHDVIKRYARQHIKENYDMVDLCIAKAEIQERVETEWEKTRKSESRVKMAKWLGSTAIEGYGKIEVGIQQNADRFDSQKESPNKEQMIMPEPDTHHSNGISAIGQVIIATNDLKENCNISINEKEGIMTTKSKEQKEAKKAPKVKKGGKPMKKSEKAVNKDKRGKTVKGHSKKNSLKKEVAAKSRPLDLTGWDYSYGNR